MPPGIMYLGIQILEEHISELKMGMGGDSHEMEVMRGGSDVGKGIPNIKYHSV